jgi:TatA/E family protein of Tat protein translocase
MLGVHPLFIVGLLLIVLIIFGPGRLPELGGAIGKGIREFRKATDGVKEDLAKAIEEPNRESTTTATTATSEPVKSESEPAKK